jgi:hypothetical protein
MNINRRADRWELRAALTAATEAEGVFPSFSVLLSPGFRMCGLHTRRGQADAPT